MLQLIARVDWKLSLGVFVTPQVTNATFYLLRKEQRPEWLYSVFWVHDAVLGYLILAPFYVLSAIRAINGARLAAPSR